MTEPVEFQCPKCHHGCCEIKYTALLTGPPKHPKEYFHVTCSVCGYAFDATLTGETIEG